MTSKAQGFFFLFSQWKWSLIVRAYKHIPDWTPRYQEQHNNSETAHNMQAVRYYTQVLIHYSGTGSTHEDNFNTEHSMYGYANPK